MLSAKEDKPSDSWETSNQVICRLCPIVYLHKMVYLYAFWVCQVVSISKVDLLYLSIMTVMEEWINV